MNESKYISQKISKLVCQLKLNQQQLGTGILYRPKFNEGNIFLITAKHNILHENNCLKADICSYEIHFNTTRINGTVYKLNIKNRILVSSNREDDLALITIPTNDIFSIIDDLPAIDIIEDNGNIRNAFFYGYPIGFTDNFPKRVDVLINPPFNNECIDLSSTIESETNLVANTVHGLSGSGIVISCNNDIFLVGIITKFLEWKRFQGLSLKIINRILSANGFHEENILTIETDEKKIIASERLKQNSLSTLNFIDNNIVNIHIDRGEIVSKIVDTIGSNKLTVVHGVAGAGKSACCKAALSVLEQNHGYNTISIKGEQLCQNNVMEFFSKVKIDIPLEEVLNSIEYIGNTLIYIDAAEKTIENNKPDVIKEIISLANRIDNLKILLSIRSYAFTQTTFGLYYTLPTDMQQIEIDLLTTTELQQVISSYPAINKLADNNKIYRFIRTPFYLKNVILVLTQIKGQESNISEGELKKVLWNTIVRKNSLQRELIFQEIALKRSRELTPYITFDVSSDSEPYFQQLISESIIVEHEDDIGIKTYAPAHDIFEDWALVRQIQIIYKDNFKSENFITTLDNSYGYQRGFKFWLHEIFETNEQEAIGICNSILFSTTIDTKWKNQIIVSILNSSCTYKYLTLNKVRVNEDSFRLLVRFIFFLRTTCKIPDKSAQNKISFYDDREYSSSEKMLPRGKAWTDIIMYLWENYNETKKIQLVIVQLLIEWGKGIHNYLPEGGKQAGLLIVATLDNLRDEYDRRPNGMTKFIDDLIHLLFKLPSEVNNEILELINTAQEYLTNFRTNTGQKSLLEYSHRDYYSTIINTCLSWKHTEELAKYFPEKIFELAKTNWLKDYPEDYERSVGETAHYFGLDDDFRRDYFPSSAHHTPVLHLLDAYPESTLTFIVDIVNHAIGKYIKSTFAQNDEILNIEIILNNGNTITLYGSDYLWSIYRGMGKVSPYLLQSILMAFEKWLLKRAQSNDRKTIEYVFNYVLHHSNSVCMISILASVSLAYPFVVGECMFPLFSSVDLIRWDLHRFASERGYVSIGFPLEGKEHADIERKEADNLAHRENTLEHLAFRMSFYEGYSEKILEWIDKHESDITKKSQKSPDIDFSTERLILNRMDKRMYKVTEQTNQGIILQAEIKEDLKPIVDKAEEFRKQSTIQLTIGQWARKIYDDGDELENTWDNWQNNYSTIVNDTGIDAGIIRLYGYSGGIAAIGIKYYSDKLNIQQFNWCKSTILEIAPAFASRRNYYEGLSDYSPLNKAPALQSLPLLLKEQLNEDEKLKVKAIIIQALFELELSDGTSIPVFQNMAQSLWNIDGKLALQCLYGFINLGKHDFKHGDNKVNTVIDEIKNNSLQYEQDIVPKYEYFNEYFLDKAFLLTSENNAIENNALRFLKAYIDYIVESTYVSEKDFTNRRDYYYNIPHFEKRFGYLLLNQKSDTQQIIFNYFLNHFYKSIDENLDYLSTDSFKLGRECLEYIIYTVDRTKQDEQFITLWRIFLKRIIESNRAMFIPELLLNIQWKDTADDWLPLSANKEFFIAVLNLLGVHAIESSIKLVSGIGSKSMLPEVLPLVEKLVTNHTEYKDRIVSYHFEKLIQKCFYRHGNEIKTNPTFKSSFLNILDAGIERGSAIAFIIKENIISL